MSRSATQSPDPIGWCILFSLTFAGVGAIGLGIPSEPYFDEVHYLPAARALLDMSVYLNREHPLLGKEILAVGIWLFGDHATGWRIFPLAFGTLTLFAASRALWFASLSRIATIAFAILLTTGFLLFVQARIAMLDIFMAGFVAVAAWQFAAAIRNPASARWRLVVTGIAIGCAMASKWNAVTLAILPGLAFFFCRWRANGSNLLFTRQGPFIPTIGLWEAAFLLGVLPIAIYVTAFLPVWFFAEQAIVQDGIVELHRSIIAMQGSVVTAHPYQSDWLDWLLNRRSIWYLYEYIDGAQRGILLIGNPLTMMLGLPALAWCAWVAYAEKRRDALAVTVGFCASLGLWLIADKPVQFYYHYLLPSCFLLAALALALDAIWQAGYRWVSLSVLAGSAVLFGWFYPILSASPLEGEGSFAKWMWLESWI